MLAGRQRLLLVLCMCEHLSSGCLIGRLQLMGLFIRLSQQAQGEHGQVMISHD